MLAIVLALQTAASPALAPVSKWQVEYNKDECVLSRSFGDLARPLVFGVRPLPLAAAGELAVVLPNPLPGGKRWGRGSVTLLPDGKVFAVQWSKGWIGSDRHGVRFDVEAEFWDALPSASAMTLDLGAKLITVTFGSIGGALQAAKMCTDDLLKQWNIEPSATTRMSSSQAQA